MPNPIWIGSIFIYIYILIRVHHGAWLAEISQTCSLLPRTLVPTLVGVSPGETSTCCLWEPCGLIDPCDTRPSRARDWGADCWGEEVGQGPTDDEFPASPRLCLKRLSCVRSVKALVKQWWFGKRFIKNKLTSGSKVRESNPCSQFFGVPKLLGLW